MPDNLMGIKEVAKFLKMNKMTIYKLAREGRMPAFKIASEWRFKRDLLDKWLMKQLRGGDGIRRANADVSPYQCSTILVVDDENVICDFFACTLKEYRILTAAGGEEALEIVARENPDIILLDIKMPGIDGIETLKRIKKINKESVVIMLSAYATLEDNFEATRLGAYSSMSKPFDIKDIRAVIKDALKVKISG